MAYNHPNDYELLEKGMLIYDALYSWAKHLQKEKHTQQPFEHLLLEVLNRRQTAVIISPYRYLPGLAMSSLPR
ncbi:chromate resistance protein [Paraflavitalea soli]|uniref:chromate resistance protein n=1 Tax=Paraflavitalea soli TaxID=2315862 RepID=UPI001FE9B5FC|nr:chromate resistance protein [Paraflavitalea soli]